MRQLSKLTLGLSALAQLRMIKKGESRGSAIPLHTLNYDRRAPERAQDTQPGWHVKAKLMSRSLVDACKAPGQKFNERFPSWRGGIVLFTTLTAIVFTFNLATLIWAMLNRDDGSFSTISTKTCDSAEAQSWWLQLLINVLSSILLAGSSYCMQCLSAPTRDEVDRAHANHSFLDIGILSLRNIRSFRGTRAVLWVLLALSSFPLHLVYNSAVQKTGAAQEYDVVLVSEGFFQSATWDEHDISREIHHQLHGSWEERISRLQNLASQDQIWNTTRWRNMTADTCLEHYSAQPQMGLGSALVVTDYSDYQNHTAFMFAQGKPHDNFWTEYWPIQTEHQKHSETDHVGKTQILYCLGLSVPGRCRIQVQIWFLLVVVACNAMKLVCMLLTLWEKREPLATLGDALASFLQEPCSSSEGLCLLSEAEIKKTVQARKDGDLEGPRPQKWQPERFRYYRAVKFHRWLVYTTLCGLIFMGVGYFYNDIMVKYRGDRSSLWNMGLGKLDNYRSGGPFFIGPPAQITVTRPNGSFAKVPVLRLWPTIVSANAPSTIVSIAYILINSQLTAIVQLRDWASLASRSQPLRVSNPAPGSKQTSTYRLSLPYKYSLTILATCTLLNWFVSQSLFFYRYKVFNEVGEDLSLGTASYQYFTDSMNTGLGYSGLGVVCTLAFGGIIFVASVAVGAQRCEAGLPLGANNSLVISAACHPPEDDRDSGEKLVQWGAVRSEGNRVMHCCLTSREVEMPVAGKFYA